MKPVERALHEAVRRLPSCTDTPRLDAELLMAHALGIERDRLILSPPDGPVPPAFDELLQRRCAGEPVAYITGRRAFWNIELEVGPGALIPRPDSETLIEAAIDHFGTASPSLILDLGTGPGTLLLAALDLWPAATGLGIDRSEAALGYARRNAERLGLAARATFRMGDWAEGIQDRFDLLLCNPPYVATDDELGPGVAEHEPAEALFGGSDGLDDYRRLAPVVGTLLRKGGLAAIEIGFDQADRAAALFAKAGLSPTLAHDLAGRPRATLDAQARGDPGPGRVEVGKGGLVPYVEAAVARLQEPAADEIEPGMDLREAHQDGDEALLGPDEHPVLVDARRDRPGLEAEHAGLTGRGAGRLDRTRRPASGPPSRSP